MALDLGVYSGKVCTAQEAVATIKTGSQIFAGTACATPRVPLGALESLENAPDDVTISSFLVTLKNGKKVLLRPARASGGSNITELFHALNEDDIHTRFFSRLKTLSFMQTQQLCNVNFEDEAAFIAVSGERENEEIAGSSCYFLNPSMNIAETRYMVAKEWQGSGLGKALQNHMKDYAIKSGIRGFKSEVLSSNDRMIALAQLGGENVKITREYDTHEITVYFDK